MDDNPLELIDFIYGTKLYWCLERCLEKKSTNRYLYYLIFSIIYKMSLAALEKHREKASQGKCFNIAVTNKRIVRRTRRKLKTVVLKLILQQTPVIVKPIPLQVVFIMVV